MGIRKLSNIGGWTSKTSYTSFLAGNAKFIPPYTGSIAVGGDSTNKISAYPWSASSGFGAKYSNPATPPTQYVSSAAFGSSSSITPSTDIVLGSGATPFIHAYPWSLASGFGTKYTDPATLPVAGSTGVAFHPAGNAIVYATYTTSNSQVAYPFSSGTGFGTKYADPSPHPGVGNFTQKSRWNPAGTDIVIATYESNLIATYTDRKSTRLNSSHVL